MPAPDLTFQKFDLSEEVKIAGGGLYGGVTAIKQGFQE
jgi:hypothetical protein